MNVLSSALAVSDVIQDEEVKTEPYTVVVTRAAAQSQSLVSILKGEGLEVILLPALSMRIRMPEEQMPMWISNLRTGEYRWIVFTSINAVQAFHSILTSKSQDAETSSLPGMLSELKIAAVGARTAQEVKTVLGRGVDILPSSYHAQSLIESLAEGDVKDCGVLVPCARGAGKVIEAGLKGHGARVERVEVYDTRVGEPGDAALERLYECDSSRLLFTFCSPSAFEHTRKMLGVDSAILDSAILDSAILDSAILDSAILDSAKIATIGPVTSRAVRAAGLTVDLEADPHTAERLGAAVVAWHTSRE